jgi:hypothetical protein
MSDVIRITDKRGKGKPRPKEPEFFIDGAEPPPWWPVFIAFEAERNRQLEKWGDQRGKRSDGTGSVFFRQWAEEYQRQNDAREEAGKEGVWAKILLEEVFEALAEDDPERLEYELVQAGAVVTAWLEDLVERRSGGPQAA